MLHLNQVLSALDVGMTLEELSKHYSVDPKEISGFLEKFGYSFDESAKKWMYNGEEYIKPNIKRSKKQQEHVVVLPRWINEQLEQFAKKTSFDKNTLIKLAVLEFVENHTNEERL